MLQVLRGRRRRAGCAPGISTTQIVTIRRAIATAAAALAGLAAVAGAAACAPTSRPSAADVAFATAMVPHHEMGLTLDEIALARTDDVRVRHLAFEMSNYQGPELDQLRAWRDQWADARPDPAAAPHDEPMGMPSESDLDGLRAATGRAFDRRFLTVMIAHHEGAVAMAEHEQAGGAVPAARRLAAQVARVQVSQLAAMRALLGELG